MCITREAVHSISVTVRLYKLLHKKHQVDGALRLVTGQTASTHGFAGLGNERED